MNSPLATLIRNPPFRSTMGNRSQKSWYYDGKKEAEKSAKSKPRTALGNVWDGKLGMESNRYKDWLTVERAKDATA